MARTHKTLTRYLDAYRQGGLTGLLIAVRLASAERQIDRVEAQQEVEIVLHHRFMHGLLVKKGELALHRTELQLRAQQAACPSHGAAR